MITMDAGVRLSGPLLGTSVGAALAEGVIRRYQTESVQAVALRGVDLVRQDYDIHHRRPTGYARSQVEVIPDPERARVGDGGIVYGPWLEGVSERNKTTRFKGYATFRRSRIRLALEAPVIARSILPYYLRALGGR
jgi:hypothetical protein